MKEPVADKEASITRATEFYIDVTKGYIHKKTKLQKIMYMNALVYGIEKIHNFKASKELKTLLRQVLDYKLKGDEYIDIFIKFHKIVDIEADVAIPEDWYIELEQRIKEMK